MDSSKSDDLYSTDTRNVVDEFKGWEHEDIVRALDERGVELEIAIENMLRDYNMGSIVRTANAFGVRKVHIIGRKQWNKRGAMATEKYLHLLYHSKVDEFVEYAKNNNKYLLAVDNVPGATELSKAELPRNAIMIFGQEGPGISQELSKVTDQIVAIEQIGSTRSLNVASASAIAMYEWVKIYYLSK